MKARVGGLVVGFLLLGGGGTCQASTNYTISEFAGAPRSLLVTAERPQDFQATTLMLRGTKFGIGIQPQIRSPNCDRRPLMPAGVGVWKVPAGCRRVSWQIEMEAIGSGDASTQRSAASSDGSFRLLSEASSLPKFAGSKVPESLTVSQVRARYIFPVPETDGTLTLPAQSQAPLFVLFAKKPFAELSSEKVRILYFIDDPTEAEQVAPIKPEMAGLQWLSEAAAPGRKITFAYAWLGLPPRTKSLGGATGKALLLVNYLRGPAVRQPVMVTGAPLVKAAHQVMGLYGSPPAWVGESLAMYLGLRALQHALPNNAQVSVLEKGLLVDSNHFSRGLLDVQRLVRQGNSSEYDAFFTKGVAFWSDCDRMMKRAQETGLAGKLKGTVSARYRADGSPPDDFAATVGLSPQEWDALYRKYLRN